MSRRDIIGVLRRRWRGPGRRGRAWSSGEDLELHSGDPVPVRARSRADRARGNMRATAASTSASARQVTERKRREEKRREENRRKRAQRSVCSAQSHYYLHYAL